MKDRLFVLSYVKVRDTQDRMTQSCPAHSSVTSNSCRAPCRAGPAGELWAQQGHIAWLAKRWDRNEVEREAGREAEVLVRRSPSELEWKSLGSAYVVDNLGC